MDRLSKERRSWDMSGIRSRDTRPERLVRSVLHRLGFRFRKTTGIGLPGRPDIVLPKHRIAMFRSRLLLASPPRLSLRLHAQDKGRLLGTEVWAVTWPATRG